MGLKPWANSGDSGLTCYNSGGRPAISLSRGIIWVAQACVRRLDIDKKTANWKKTLVGNVKKTAARKLTMVGWQWGEPGGQ